MAIRYFKGIEKDIKVEFNGLTSIPVPEYVDRARKRFSFDQDSGILVKQCSSCGDPFPVACLTKDGTWEDIHSEEAVHYDGKAFRSDCNRCYQEKRSERAEKSERSEQAEKAPYADKPVNSDKASNSEPQKVSVWLHSKDRNYLKMCAGYLGITVWDVLAEMIDNDRKTRKFDY